MRQLILDIRPDAPPRLDNYLPGGNAEAVQTLRRLAQGEAVEAVVYLWGPAGVGKTHLLQALVQAGGQRSRYLAAGDPLPAELPPLLVVDDVQRLDVVSQVGLFNLINAAKEGLGVVVAAGDAAPARLGLRPDLASRLAWGLVYGLVPLDDADKLTALNERAQAHGLTLPEEVGRYLLAHCRRELPNLLGLVDALDAYSVSLKRPVSLPLLREMLARQGET